MYMDALLYFGQRGGRVLLKAHCSPHINSLAAIFKSETRTHQLTDLQLSRRSTVDDGFLPWVLTHRQNCFLKVQRGAEHICLPAWKIEGSTGELGAAREFLLVTVTAIYYRL